MGRCDGKVVVVTGAARGQGAEEARALAAEGATVIATDVLDFEQFDAEGAGWDIPVVERHLDVTSEADWAELTTWLEQRARPGGRAGQQRRRGRP